MSGFEVIGAVASVAQIANYLLVTSSAINHLCKSIGKAPARIKQYESSLKQLADILEVIRKNEWLQTDGIRSIIEQIFTVVQKLQALLVALGIEGVAEPTLAKRCWRGIKIVSKEGEISTKFAVLEEKKGILGLCIQEVQAKFAGDTSCDVREVLRIMRPVMERITHINNSPAASPVTQCCVSPLSGGATLCADGPPNVADQSNGGGNDKTWNDEDPKCEGSRHDAPPLPNWKSASRLYMHATVGSNSRQFNGDFVNGSGSLPEVSHIGPRVGDFSCQFNGNVVDHTEFLAAFFDVK